MVFSLITVSYTLAANAMESLLLNSSCVNLIGIYCFWSYVQLQNEILLISSIHYITKLIGQTQSVLSGDHWDSRAGKNRFRGSHLKWSLLSHYHFDAFMQRGVSVKTIDISLNFNLPEQILQRIVRLSQLAILSEKKPGCWGCLKDA